MTEQITFHQAWGVAKDRADYHKPAWNDACKRFDWDANAPRYRYSFPTWYELVYGRTMPP